MSQQPTTTPTPRQEHRGRTIAGVAAAITIAFVLGAGVVLFASAATSSPTTHSASNPATVATCGWMTNWPAGQTPSSSWCTQMNEWAQAHMSRTGMMAAQPSSQAMYDACITAMTNTRGVADPTSWCQQMAIWMAGHWSDNNWTMGPWMMGR